MPAKSKRYTFKDIANHIKQSFPGHTFPGSDCNWTRLLPRTDAVFKVWDHTTDYQLLDGTAGECWFNSAGLVNLKPSRFQMCVGLRLSEDSKSWHAHAWVISFNKRTQRYKVIDPHPVPGGCYFGAIVEPEVINILVEEGSKRWRGMCIPKKMFTTIYDRENGNELVAWGSRAPRLFSCGQYCTDAEKLESMLHCSKAPELNETPLQIQEFRP